MPKKPPALAPDHILRRTFSRRRSCAPIAPSVWERMAALTADAVRQGRVTKCPTVYAAGPHASFSNDRI